MEFFISQTFNALSYAGLLFLLGGGMTLIFGTMKIVNIAHGGFYLLGGYTGYVVGQYTGNFFLAILGACATVGLVGMALERFLLRTLSGQLLRQMLMTMGITLFIADLMLIIFEGYPLTLSVPAYIGGTVELWGMRFHLLRIFMIVCALLVYTVLWYLQEKTRAGAIVRAVVDNAEVAQGIGINVDRVSMAIFGLGALLAAFAGVIGSAFTAIYPGLDFSVLPLAFVVVILGGMGSLKGALVGAIIVGFIDNFAKALVPELAYFSLFFPMIVMLSIKPTGLFSRERL
jgi:branched-chain amino acid transport system permease protein